MKMPHELRSEAQRYRRLVVKEQWRCFHLIQEYTKRIRVLRDRQEHIKFMVAHGAEADIQPRIEGYNDWAADCPSGLVSVTAKSQ